MHNCPHLAKSNHGSNTLTIRKGWLIWRKYPRDRHLYIPIVLLHEIVSYIWKTKAWTYLIIALIQTGKQQFSFPKLIRPLSYDLLQVTSAGNRINRDVDINRKMNYITISLREDKACNPSARGCTRSTLLHHIKYVIY